MTGRTVPLETVVRYLDQLLRVSEILDYPDAFNGLEV